MPPNPFQNLRCTWRLETTSGSRSSREWPVTYWWRSASPAGYGCCCCIYHADNLRRQQGNLTCYNDMRVEQSKGSRWAFASKSPFGCLGQQRLTPARAYQIAHHLDRAPGRIRRLSRSREFGINSAMCKLESDGGSWGVLWSSCVVVCNFYSMLLHRYPQDNWSSRHNAYL